MKLARINRITGEFRIGDPETFRPILEDVRIVARHAAITVEIGANEIAAAIERSERPCVLLVAEFIARRPPKTLAGDCADFDILVNAVIPDDGSGNSLPDKYEMLCEDEDVEDLRRQLRAEGWQPAD